MLPLVHSDWRCWISSSIGHSGIPCESSGKCIASSTKGGSCLPASLGWSVWHCWMWSTWHLTTHSSDKSTSQDTRPVTFDYNTWLKFLTFTISPTAVLLPSAFLSWFIFTCYTAASEPCLADLGATSPVWSSISTDSAALLDSSQSLIVELSCTATGNSAIFVWMQSAGVLVMPSFPFCQSIAWRMIRVCLHMNDAIWPQELSKLLWCKVCAIIRHQHIQLSLIHISEPTRR